MLVKLKYFYVEEKKRKNKSGLEEPRLFDK